jgi:hypothetical protein
LEGVRFLDGRTYRNVSRPRMSKTFTTRITRFRSLERCLEKPGAPVGVGLLFSSSNAGIESCSSRTVHNGEQDQKDMSWKDESG